MKMGFNEVMNKLNENDRIDQTDWCMGYISALRDHEIIELGLYTHIVEVIIDRNFCYIE